MQIKKASVSQIFASKPATGMQGYTVTKNNRLRSKITKPAFKVRDPKIYQRIYQFPEMTFPILVCGSYLLRQFCDVTNKACFGVFSAIDWPIKTPYFRNNFRRNRPISKMFTPKR